MRRHTADLAARDIVVVVDDDPAVRNSLKFSLEIEGFAVRIFGSGGELLEARDLPSAAVSSSTRKCLG